MGGYGRAVGDIGKNMAKQADAKQNVFVRLRTFLEEVQTELGKVTWPSREDLAVSTKVTMYLLLAMAGIVFVFDKVFEVVVLTLLQLT